MTLEDKRLLVIPLSRNMTDGHLAEIFSHYGNVIDAVIPRAKDSPIQRRLGFVEFENRQDAMRAIDYMDGVSVTIF
jgi:RNA recognition motif-containing protein